jgi:microcompartment protein CcmL/EutN
MGPLRRAEGQAICVDGPALGLVETGSIARGIVVADAMVKRAQIRLLLNRPVSPGKHLCLCCGDVAEVQEAMDVGRTQAGTKLCDELFLAQVHTEVIAALSRTQPAAPPDDRSLGVLETYSAAATLLAADGACKAAEVTLFELRLCDGIGGKAFAIFLGEQDMVEAALAAGEALLSPGLFLGSELIPRPHPDMLAALSAQ